MSDPKKFSSDTVGYIDPEEFEREYLKKSTRNGKGTAVGNDSVMGKWLIAAITFIIIIGLTFFYMQNDDTRKAFEDSLRGNTTNPNVDEVTENIGDNDYAPKGPNNASTGNSPDTKESGYYDEDGDYRDGMEFDADELTKRISAIMETDSKNDACVFVIGEWNEKLAIYLDGNPEPLEVYNTYVDDLPEADRNYIKRGIRVTSISDLSTYLEDLTS